MEDLDLKVEEEVIVKEYKKAQNFSKYYTFSAFVCSLLVLFGAIGLAVYLGFGGTTVLFFAAFLVAVYAALVWATWLFISAKHTEVEGSYLYLQTKYKDHNDAEDAL